MALKDLIENDWRYIDGVEEVTLLPKNPSGSAISGIKCLKQKTTKTDLAIAGVGAADAVFHLWTATMGDEPPEVENEFVIRRADKSKWTIQFCQLTTLDTRWRCICRKQL